MKLWLLRPKEDFEGCNPWKPWYDKNFGFVIRAETEIKARQTANEEAQYENYDCDGITDVWLNSEYSSCTELISHSKEEIIIKDFRGA